jgi:hypothetical protein
VFCVALAINSDFFPLDNIKRLIFVAEAKCDSCEKRTDILYIIIKELNALQTFCHSLHVSVCPLLCSTEATAATLLQYSLHTHTTDATDAIDCLQPPALYWTDPRRSHCRVVRGCFV